MHHAGQGSIGRWILGWRKKPRTVLGVEECLSEPIPRFRVAVWITYVPLKRINEKIHELGKVKRYSGGAVVGRQRWRRLGILAMGPPSSRASTTCRKSWNDVRSTWIELAPGERIPSTLTTSTTRFPTGSTGISRNPLPFSRVREPELQVASIVCLPAITNRIGTDKINYEEASSIFESHPVSLAR